MHEKIMHGGEVYAVVGDVEKSMDTLQKWCNLVAQVISIEQFMEKM